jgi:uncharacterized membrane protein (UPF0127 family)
MAELSPLRNLTRDTVVAERVATAASLWARFRGLMGRSSLAAEEALWLPGTNGIHMFFMRFPIDCAFLGKPDADGVMTVLDIRRALPPWTGIVPFVRGAAGVVELAAGSLERTRTAVGDRLMLGARAD